ncbi:MAG: hypothetical protein H7096_03355 [Flavobacterium sp.]|nr:hypothetical protein [Pedobacter sp.]
MLEPFDITVNGTIYSIFPEEDDIYTVFKEGIEFVKIQKDTERWLKLDDLTELPRFEEDEEVNQIGSAINNYRL